VIYPSDVIVEAQIVKQPRQPTSMQGSKAGKTGPEQLKPDREKT